MSERADALMVAAKCCRVVVDRTHAQDVRTVLSGAGAPDIDCYGHPLSEVLRAWGEAQIIGLAEVFEKMAQVDDAKWADIRRRTANS